jgi:hypothetical protein
MRRSALAAILFVLVAACGGSGDASDSTAGATTGDTAASATTAAETPETTVDDDTGSTSTTATTAAVDEEGDRGSSASWEELAERVAGAPEVSSARVDGLMTIVGVPDVGDVEVPFTSTFDLASKSSSIVMDLAGFASIGGDESVPADMLGDVEIRQIGDQTFMQMSLFTLMTGSESGWVSLPAEETGSFGADLGVETNPNSVFDDYRDADATVTELGDETVNGVDATRYSVVIDTEEWLATLTPEERAELEENGPVPLSEFPLDLWVSDDGYIIRMLLSIEGDSVEFEGAEDFESMTVQYDVVDINEPVEIVAPDDFVDLADIGGVPGG